MPKMSKKPLWSFKKLLFKKKNLKKGQRQSNLLQKREKERGIQKRKKQSMKRKIQTMNWYQMGAYAIMKETLMQKDFYGERGFVKLISPFRELIEKRS